MIKQQTEIYREKDTSYSDVVEEAFRVIADKEYSEPNSGRFRLPGLLGSFQHAFEGIKYALKTQRNLRIQAVFAFVVAAAAIILKLPAIEMAIVLLVSASVMVCELINTALELTLDFFNGKRFNRLVKAAKDVIAASVLLAAFNACLVGAVIFSRHIADLMR